VLRRDPQNVAALFYRAFVNEKMHRYNFARRDYEAVLSMVPGNFESRLGLALLNQKDHHYTEAIDHINLLVSQYPDSAVAYAARGGMEVERGMLELAEYDFGKAISLAPCNTDYRLSRADVRLRLKRKDEAREDLDEMVKRGVSRANLADWYAKCR
jgi:tetratricopeptide (TPR) repeat protein